MGENLTTGSIGSKSALEQLAKLGVGLSPLTPPIKTKSIVEESFDSLEFTVNKARDLLACIALRLGPVLSVTDRESTEKNVEGEDMGIPLVDTITHLNSRLRIICDDMERLKDRIVL